MGKSDVLKVLKIARAVGRMLSIGHNMYWDIIIVIHEISIRLVIMPLTGSQDDPGLEIERELH